ALDVGWLQQAHLLEQFQRADAAASLQHCLGRLDDAFLEVAVRGASHAVSFFDGMKQAPWQARLLRFRQGLSNSGKGRARHSVRAAVRPRSQPGTHGVTRPTRHDRPIADFEAEAQAREWALNSE